MPNRWPITSGSWSNAAIWSGSLIPTASDDVFLNNQVITLDQDVTVRSIRIAATGSAIAGGQLNIYSDYNITATTTQSVDLGGLDSNGATVTGGFIKYYNSGSITITAHLVCARNTLENVNNGTITIVGDVRLPNNLLTSARTITNTLNGTINILGNITTGSTNQNSNYAVLNAYGGTVSIIGNVTAGNAAGSHAIFNNVSGSINVTGNVRGSTVASTYGINNVNGIVNVTGNVTAGTNTTSHGINNSSIGKVNVTGTVTGGASSGAGINATTAGIINVIGQLQATTTANAVSSTATTATNIFSGPLINSGSRNAIYCYNVQLYDNVTTRYSVGVSGSTSTITMFSPDQVTGVPSGSDVRLSVNYGPGNELTGSMAVPQPASVSVGVAIDNTTGSAVTKPQDIWNALSSTLIVSNSIGERLSNAATVESTAAIISAYTI
ncbi:hypothetical protein UFOVP723_206 [uncultured Caudovirales phage]|uniref:Uncharacterized protein n=1 Tax=uncultured Caudovirales phage TaxID=2100421 RepID=A0A6J5NNH5_9CAUD|nr:hypothetical protein UFOVP723_206 [uncultured Caudovirales phage]